MGNPDLEGLGAFDTPGQPHHFAVRAEMLPPHDFFVPTLVGNPRSGPGNYDAENVGNAMLFDGASGAIPTDDVVFFAPSGWAGFVCTVDKVATEHFQPQKTHIGAI